MSLKQTIKKMKELIIGEVYNVEKKENQNLFLWGGLDSICYIYRVPDTTLEFYNEIGGFTLTSYTTLATSLEKAWLLECKKQNKLIPFEKINLEYEIY